MTPAFCVFGEMGNAINLGDDGKIFGHTSLKEFFHTWQALGDIALTPRDPSTVEGAHGQLCSWLTNGLCGNNPYCHSQLDQGTARKIPPITLTAYAAPTLAGQHRAHTHQNNLCLANTFYCLLIQLVTG